MNIMRKRDRAAAVKTVGVDADAVTDGVGGVVLPVLGVDVRVDDLVAEAPERLQGLVVIGEVRGPHIRREPADDAEEGVLELGHLVGDAISA